MLSPLDSTIFQLGKIIFDIRQSSSVTFIGKNVLLKKKNVYSN